MLFPGISLGVALLIGAALAPTDAALGQPVVTNRAVPARIRRLLNAESGLNDGIATPFVILALALATAEGTGLSDWLVEAVDRAGPRRCGRCRRWPRWRPPVARRDERRWTSTVSRQLFVLALAAACYLLAVIVGGNGFIAAFMGGLAFGRGSRQREEGAVRFTEMQGSLLAIGVWVAFGLTLAGNLLTRLWDPAAIAYAILSLTVIRMLPVAIALAGERFQPLSVLFMGWFGPRGLASIVFLVIGLEGLRGGGVDPGPSRQGRGMDGVPLGHRARTDSRSPCCPLRPMDRWRGCGGSRGRACGRAAPVTHPLGERVSVGDGRAMTANSCAVGS